MDLPPEIVSALAPFAPLFSDRAWANAQVLAVGALLVNGRRDPDGQHRDAAYLCTDEGFTAGRVLGLVVRRRSLEVTF